MSFREYIAPDGEPWRVENGDALAAAFELTGNDAAQKAALAEWHGALAGTARVWGVVRRLYGVHAMFGVTDPSEMVPHSAAALAAELGLSERQVVEIDMEARTFWRRHKLSTRERGAAVAPTEEAVVMTDAEVAALLGANGFANLTDGEQRRYVASRLVDLEELVDSAELRAIARGMVRTELMLFFVIDKRIAAIEEVIGRKESHDPPHDVTKENKQLMELLKERGGLQTSIQDTMKALGITESQTGNTKKKGAFQASISGMIEAVKAYHARQDTELIDGILTGAEIEILTKPFVLREEQYRPDLAFVVPHAIEGLFDPHYQPPVLGRMAHRRLSAGFRQGLAALRSETGEEVRDLDDDSRADVVSQSDDEELPPVPPLTPQVEEIVRTALNQADSTAQP